jgi:ferredoxin
VLAGRLTVRASAPKEEQAVDDRVAAVDPDGEPRDLGCAQRIRDVAMTADRQLDPTELRLGLDGDESPRRDVDEHEVDVGSSGSVYRDLEVPSERRPRDRQERLEHLRLEMIPQERPGPGEQADRQVGPEPGRETDERLEPGGAFPTLDPGDVGRVDLRRRTERPEAQPRIQPKPAELEAERPADLEAGALDLAASPGVHVGVSAGVGGWCRRCRRCRRSCPAPRSRRPRGLAGLAGLVGPVGLAVAPQSAFPDFVVPYPADADGSRRGVAW